MTALKRILRYLKRTASLAIKYQKSDDGDLIGYSDADWAGDADDRHSTSGNLFLLAGGPISWQSKKQGVVALSTCEAEYVALSAAVQEAIWLKKLVATTTKIICTSGISFASVRTVATGSASSFLHYSHILR